MNMISTGLIHTYVRTYVRYIAVNSSFCHIPGVIQQVSDLLYAMGMYVRTYEP